jgi:hypothetical protein
MNTAITDTANRTTTTADKHILTDSVREAMHIGMILVETDKTLSSTALTDAQTDTAITKTTMDTYLLQKQ